MFPIRDNTPRDRPPLLTVGFILANAAVFVIEMRLPDRQLFEFMHIYGVVPRRYADPGWAASVGYSYNPLSFLTSMFLHGGILHILSNMWILWIFGDNIEDRMGALRFFGFYLLCGVVATVTHVVSSPSAEVPVVGASGAIAGVLGAYFVMYPFARVLCVFPIFFYPLFFEVPAFVFLFFWFFAQVYSGTIDVAVPSEAGGVAWWAHIGGFLAGMFLHRVFVKYPPPLRGPIRL